MHMSEPCLETISEQEAEDNGEDLGPLNLSTRNSDREKSPSDHRLRCLETEKLKQEELPLNLSLRASSNSPVNAGCALGPSDDLQQRQNAELDDEPCDQRQTAALALCQLATASSAASSCDLSTTPLEECKEEQMQGLIKKTKNKTKTKAKGLKRANGEKTESCSNKKKKRAKAPELALRRRPR